MRSDPQSTLRFWGPTFDFTAARELHREYTADARLLRIELPADDEIARSVMDTEFDGVPGPYTNVTDDAVRHGEGRWTGRLDVVSFERRDGARIVVLTYRNTEIKSDFEKLLEALP